MRSVVGRQDTHIALQSIIEDVATEAQKLRERRAEQIGHIERNRYIVHNAWVIWGTRIPVRAIKRFYDAGYSTEAILKEYPNLTARRAATAQALVAGTASIKVRRPWPYVDSGPIEAYA